MNQKILELKERSTSFINGILEKDKLNHNVDEITKFTALELNKAKEIFQAINI